VIAAPLVRSLTIKGGVEYTTHAEDQMVDREITRADVEAVEVERRLPGRPMTVKKRLDECNW
jgi:hypothetical protein